MLFHLLLPFLAADGPPCILATSFLDSFKVPPENFPTTGASTPRSLLPLLYFAPFLLLLDILTFSRMTPFSLASCRRLVSFRSAFFTIPTRCATGIFFCENSDSLAPSACNLMSNAFCLSLPGVEDTLDRSRRCDSLRSRCRSRSCFRLTLSLSSSSSVCLLGFDVGLFSTSRGGLADCFESVVVLRFRLEPEHAHHECLLPSAVEFVVFICLVRNMINHFHYCDALLCIRNSRPF